MRLRIGFGLALMALVGGAAADEQWVGFSNDRPFSEARIEVAKTGAEIVEFDLVIPGVSVENVSTETGAFTRLEVPGLGRIGQPGEPMLPALRRFVEIPLGATAEVSATVLERATLNLAAENLALAAYGLGYGTCMIGGFKQAKTKALLGIPIRKRIRLFVAVGVADEERSNEAVFTSTGEPVVEVLPYPPEARKSLEELVHHGRYGTPYVELEQGSTRAKVVGGFRS